jgi:hypothetical protein
MKAAQSHATLCLSSWQPSDKVQNDCEWEDGGPIVV